MRVLDSVYLVAEYAKDIDYKIVVKIFDYGFVVKYYDYTTVVIIRNEDECR